MARVATGGQSRAGWAVVRVARFDTDPTALPIHEATTEVDRYISWPGQALSYYIGYLRLRELPAEAERERLIRDWIGKRKAAG
jgi:uncharacterized protein (DUF885 family)